MSKFESIKIENIKNSNITLGDKNLIHIQQNMSKVLEKDTSSTKEVWSAVLTELEILRKEIVGLPDEFETIRDEELTPVVSQTKREVASLEQNPTKEKKDFFNKFSEILAITDKSSQLLDKFRPHLLKIAEIIGVSNIQL
ncbi:hypothetical protein FZD47_10625 [Bacillus infantis]|uniref:Uncharacterized protein n=1 Tax=Bacillus infantis TaxID=324767 RepID=A0A5D4SLK1_9BACI|nr:hypothetical protein [Bacillus infantis]TYS63949.1 hypothetical protein FZD47_10625 [Bacillus infantis]